MKTDNKKIKIREKGVNLAKILHTQADKTNKQNCQPYIDDINEASKNGEYSRTLQLKVNQAHYIETLGLIVTPEEKFGYYKISW